MYYNHRFNKARKKRGVKAWLIESNVSMTKIKTLMEKRVVSR